MWTDDEAEEAKKPRKKRVRAEGGRAARRLDRPGRRRANGGQSDMPKVPVDPSRALTSPRTYMGAGSSNDPSTTTGAWAGKTGVRSGANDRKAGGRLSAAERRSMPASDFALPGHGEGPGGRGAGAYPIDTEGRARDALSRGSANATPAEQATIRRKVHARYPDIAIGGKKED